MESPTVQNSIRLWGKSSFKKCGILKLVWIDVSRDDTYDVMIRRPLKHLADLP